MSGKKLQPATRATQFSRNVLRKQGMSTDERVHEMQGVSFNLNNKSEFVAEIKVLWREAQARFILVGKYLMAAKERLPHGEFEAMILNDLPFGKGVAYQLRRAAEAIENGLLIESEIPPNYSTVYHLSTLASKEIQQARQEGVIHPEVTMAEVKSFKRKLRVIDAVEVDDNGNDVEQTKVRTELLGRRATIVSQIAKLEKELESIDRKLGLKSVS
ncbi:hypothetical protein ACFOY8_12145 [Thalassospira xianhensis]|uniref:DUF3102 domain-containing protein n=1 Tax=Thalassospira xiamenensis TaxID=220697 RepID=A0A285U1K7_9PROT|nr:MULTISPECIES: hypothetical protein [Thalassospira]SOC30454.1 hypothetical protein SAMN05428964_10949 [Thalassospira xiamenensis]